MSLRRGSSRSIGNAIPAAKGTYDKPFLLILFMQNSAIIKQGKIVKRKYTDTPDRLWIGNQSELQLGEKVLEKALDDVAKPLFIVDHHGKVAISHQGRLAWGGNLDRVSESRPLYGFAPPMYPETLGDASFKKDLGLKLAYIVGAMANGITSVEMVIAAGVAGAVGFFGAGGLSLDQINSAIDRLKPYRDRFPVGFNLIHSPNDMALEMETVKLYLRQDINLVSASAYLRLTLPLVYYRVKGIYKSATGHVICPNHVIAKVSREEVARKFFAPPPQKILDQLRHDGLINAEEAQLAQHIPMAQDITAEADSGGHTDNRPALSLFPTFMTLRDQAIEQYGFSVPLRVGLAGGMATPDAVAAGFSMGAAYILTGSINQAAVEADTSDAAREMLVQAQQADVTMAPSADMFEMGAKVQVLKRGTMFAMRAAKLYELYRTYDRYEDIPPNIIAMIERDMLRATFETAWDNTRKYFETRDPSQIERAESNPKQKMALVFRSYLGQASLWAKSGLGDRKIDYQIWCGPAMGAFNTWVKGSFMETKEQRRTDVMAMNLMYGAVRRIRCQWLSNQGIELPSRMVACKPLLPDEIQQRLRN
jgi:trans-AT polyketide synthase, acyltransferase and oxidoreductase domains